MMDSNDIYGGILEAAERSDDTVARILDTALEVFVEHGFRRSTMDDVARKAGLSRVTIYRRFQDKDALVQAVILRESRKALKAIVKEMAKLESTEERFVRGFVRTVSVARRHPLLARLIDGEPEIVLPKYVALSASQAIDLGRATMAGIIEGLQKQGDFKGQDPEFIAELLIRLWHSIVITPSSLLSADDEAKMAEFARRFLYPLLSPTQARSAPWQNKKKRSAPTS